MSEPVLSADQYAELVQERIAGLRALLGDLTREAPQSAPRRFSKSVEILIGAIESFFASRRKVVDSRPTSSAEKTDAVVFAARWSLYLLNNVQQQYLPFLEKLDSPHVPLSIQPTLQRIAAQHEPTVELYLFPESEHNFGFSGFRNILATFIEEFELVLPDELVHEIKRRLEEFQKEGELPHWFVFLSFPYVVHESALNLTPLLHELGHFVDFSRDVCSKVLPIRIPETERVTGLVDNLVKQGSNEDEVYSQCKEIVRNWVRELIADLFSTRLAGPAYFYSFVIYAANIGLETESAVSHPSPAIRIDLMLRELREMGYLSKASPHAIRSSLQKWASWVRSRKLEPGDPPMRIAFLAIDKNSAKIARAVRRWACPVPCTVRTYKETVPGLAKDLQEGIPPSDRLEAGSAQFVPSRFSDILNSAWITYMFSPQRLERLLDSKPRDKRRFAVKTLNDLVLKAIEASEIFGRCHGLPMEK